MGDAWSGVFQTILDLLSLRDSGVGPVGVAAVLFLLLYIYLGYKVHIMIVDFYQKEISRIAGERDKWENRFFDDKLRSSNSDFYSMEHKDIPETDEPDEAQSQSNNSNDEGN